MPDLFLAHGRVRFAARIVERSAVLAELAGADLPPAQLRCLDDAFTRLKLDPERGPPADDEETHAAFGAYQERLHRDGALDLDAVGLGGCEFLLRETGNGDDIAHAASDVFRAARNRVTPYDEVIDNLTRLRQRYTLVSVTNGNSQIAQTPLGSSFHHSLTAAEVGAAKPDPAIFHAASARTGVPLEAFLHVGDDPVRDIQAARDIGLTTVWVNRYDSPWPEALEPADIAGALDVRSADFNPAAAMSCRSVSLETRRHFGMPR